MREPLVKRPVLSNFMEIDEFDKVACVCVFIYTRDFILMLTPIY